jgi:chromosome segregation ATPase
VTASLSERVDRLEQQVEPLKAKVQELDTWAGRGQNDTLSANLAELRQDFKKFAKVQAGHTRRLDALTKDVAGLKTDVAGLKTDVAGLKTDVAVLKTDVAGLKTDVAGLKTDVAGLKKDMVEVKDRLSEILDRLPARREAPGR